MIIEVDKIVNVYKITPNCRYTVIETGIAVINVRQIGIIIHHKNN